MRQEMNYQHTQYSRWHYLFFLLPATAFLCAWLLRAEGPLVSGGAMLMGVLFLMVACGFQHMTVTDDGNCMRVRYGPLPLFGWTFDHKDIVDVTVGQTSFIDGWGIHYIPFRGWTLNLIGFECVVLHFENKTVRIGTNDSAGLASYLKSKL